MTLVPPATPWSSRGWHPGDVSEPRPVRDPCVPSPGSPATVYADELAAGRRRLDVLRVHHIDLVRLSPATPRARSTGKEERRGGPRTSRLDRKRAKRALTPAHAMLNYLYAILESEATIAAHRMGFDPNLGLMHADKRYRASLASDLMEPARPAADEVAFDLLEANEIRRGDVHETREGICRLGPELAKRLGGASHQLFQEVAPGAEWLARQLMGNPKHPTPLTRARHRESRLGRAR